MPIQLSPTAHALATHLHAELRGRWHALPGTGPGGSTLASFRAASVPDDLRGRRVELIVEASDLPALRAALDSDADAVVIDFDDTFSPAPANVQAAYDALSWVMASEKPLLARTRALYATEPGLDYGGPAIAALCDLAALLTAHPVKRPHLYIPKLETEAEAQFWQGVLILAEAYLGLAANTVRVCLQIETYSGLLGAGGLLYHLHSRAYGLNAGRWDYVFSLIKHLGPTRPGPVPPRPQLTMDVPAMRAYAEHLVAVCREHGAEAIGGTASLAPDPTTPDPALNAVRADKEREAAQGFTAAWAGLPELMGAVREGMAGQSAEPEGSPEANRSTALQGLHPPARAEIDATLQRLPLLTDLSTPATIPLAELRDSIGLALDVFAAWLSGRGVVIRNGRVEDTATAELARALVWQWVRVEAAVEDGGRLTRDRYLSERRALMPDNGGAARLLDHLVLSDACPAYFPREAQSLFPELFQGVSP